MPDSYLALRDQAIDLEDPAADVRRGREIRRTTPRRALAQLIAAPRGCVEILVEQNTTRVPELVPLRFARMLADPFAFYRGSAAVMAADLAASPTSGIDVVSCGDAHVSNFGVYAAPDRSLVFDLNDFDEAAVAPAEWDVKRLITSAVIGGRHAGYAESDIRSLAQGAAAAYRGALVSMLDMSVLDRYYLRVEPERYLGQGSDDLDAVIRRTIGRARKRTSARAFARITEPGPDGSPRLREDPPVLQHVADTDEAVVRAAVEEYLQTVSVDIALLVSHFRVTDVALRVVGVGSVGTRCYLTILVGPAGEPLILQVKEANQSVLEQYGGRAQPALLRDAVAVSGQGRRVVAGQRILQAMSDVFLGTVRADGHDFYVRQFHDMKGTIDTEGMTVAAFGELAEACAVLLARAHAQSANASRLQGYVGDSSKVSDAIVDFSFAYADKSLDDFRRLQAAARAGDIPVAAGPAR